MAKFEFADVKKVFENALNKKYLDQLYENDYVLLPRNDQYTQQSHLDIEYIRNKLDALIAEEGKKAGCESWEYVNF